VLGVGAKGMRRLRFFALAGTLLAALIGGATAPPLAGTARAAPLPTIARANGGATGDEVFTGGARSDGRDARGLRFGLLGLLGLALGFGAFVQCRASAELPLPPPRARRRRSPRRARAAQPNPERLAVPSPPVQTDGPSAPAVAPPPQAPAPARPNAGPQPIRLEPYLHDRLAVQPRVVRQAPVLTPAEEDCARAIKAAHRYDRHATLSAFANALNDDPGVKPSALPGFWEMPPSGHADLARAYLRRGDRLDARTVLSLALLTFPHNRELATLLRESELSRGEATA
jgi:hypothetical protein